VVSFMSEGPGPARGSETGPDAEHECRRKRYKWQKHNRPGQYGSHRSRHEGGHWGVNGVYKPEPTADKVAGKNITKDARDQSDNDLHHIEFRV
jgi:hypothetical protein